MATQLILTATAGTCAGLQFVFPVPGHCVIGRAVGCSLRLPLDCTVSRHHCLLGTEGGGLGVRDLGSLNGTFVNGFEIGHRPPLGEGDTFKLNPVYTLHPGDRLRVGQNVFLVDVVEEAAVEGEEAEAGQAECCACA
jgi:pSer/pThr/pTyr-binding forkhead associated (FHA) protein